MLANLAKIAALVAAWGPKIPQAVNLIMAFLALFGGPAAEAAGDAGGLEMTQLDDVTQANLKTITEAMSQANAESHEHEAGQPAPQQAWDGSRLLNRLKGAAKFLDDHPNLKALLFGVLSAK